MKVTLPLKLITTTGVFEYQLRVDRSLKRKMLRRAIKREVLKNSRDAGRDINIRGRLDIRIYNTLMKKEVS